MEEAERGAKKIESAVVMVTVSAINIVGRRKRNHKKTESSNPTNGPSLQLSLNR